MLGLFYILLLPWSQFTPDIKVIMSLDDMGLSIHLIKSDNMWMFKYWFRWYNYKTKYSPDKVW